MLLRYLELCLIVRREPLGDILRIGAVKILALLKLAPQYSLLYEMCRFYSYITTDRYENYGDDIFLPNLINDDGDDGDIDVGGDINYTYCWMITIFVN